MEYLNLIKNNLKIDGNKLKDIEKDIEHVNSVLVKYNINFEDHFAISFWNHIISFIDRAKNNEFVDVLGEDMVSELSEDAIKIAIELFSDIFTRYGREQNLSEIYLVSIHIQVAKQNL
ncbi:PRD domain-containing protein [Clostridium weizhouense]|uniref:PRD domain-containing protein n=1 Tax=Clostridium weizhouense TaxID=2859781 RepID=A0ABS7ANX4_9CLOT|nr:PRD domain-containing protein [Clostridium weizhouense]MBW6410111.1 PRD domain-containing protein [Clostridium weizhouense]